MTGRYRVMPKMPSATMPEGADFGIHLGWNADDVANLVAADLGSDFIATHAPSGLIAVEVDPQHEAERIANVLCGAIVDILDSLQASPRMVDELMIALARERLRTEMSMGFTPYKSAVEINDRIARALAKEISITYARIGSNKQIEDLLDSLGIKATVVEVPFRDKDLQHESERSAPAAELDGLGRREDTTTNTSAVHERPHEAG